MYGPYFTGTTDDPKKISTTIAFLATFVGGFLIYASYSASLTSFLAIQQISYPFVDMASMYYRTDFKIGSLAGNVLDDYFKVISLSTGKRLKIIYILIHKASYDIILCTLLCYF